MASLQKTYTGDLSTAIAGKLYEAITDADEKNQLEKSNASQDVKQAAVKTKKEDPDSVPVRDRDLRKTIVNFFTPIEGKLIKAQLTYNNISSKVTALAGGVADTQKLLINQNQILEDKFDQILNVIGTKNAIEAKLKAENDFKQLELNLEKGLDLSGTFAYDKAGGRSGFGLMGSVLQGILGNRMTSRLVRNLYKKIVPRGLRARARLLRMQLKPFGRVTRFAMDPVKLAVKTAVNTAIKTFTSSVLGKKGLRLGARGARVIGKGFLGERALKFGGKRLVTRRGGVTLSRALNRMNIFSKASRFVGDIPNYARLLLSVGSLNADKISDKIINEFANKATVLRNQAAKQSFKKKTGRIIQKSFLDSLLDQTISKAPKIISKTAQKSASKKIATKAGSKIATSLSDEILSSKGLISAFKNPIIQRKLTQKLGQEGMEKLLIKAGVGGGKTFAPGLGTLYAFGEGLGRISPLFGGSDPLGMLLSFGSAIPYGGWGVVMADILRDIDREAFDAHILPHLVPYNLSKDNIDSFFMQALELDNNQFERGTPNISSKMLGGVDSISEILSVTKAFGEATGFGAEVGGLIGEAGLSSYPVASGSYTFDASGDIGGGGAVNASVKEAELKKREKYKKEEEDDDDEGEVKTKSTKKRGSGVGGGQLFARISKDKKKSGIDPRILEKFPNKDPNKPGDYIFLKRQQVPLDTAINSKTPMMGTGGASTIEFHGQQGRDRSGEPGVDFSFQDYKNNYNLFPGYVLETGLLYGKGYGNVVVVRSVDPSNGKKFDALYAHFPDGGIAVKPGQQVGAGDLLGSVGFVSVDTPGVPQLQPNNAGNMSGWHTSVDFFEPGSAARYSNADKIINLITGASGSTPDGLLQRLKPPTNSGDTSTLNNIEANSNLAQTMTNMVENGSSERLVNQRNGKKRLPIVIVNNQIVNTNSTLLNFGGNQEESNFFEAYNLARYTV